MKKTDTIHLWRSKVCKEKIVVYKCNICGDVSKEPENTLFGVNQAFKLGSYLSSDSTHICICCCQKLRTELIYMK